MSWSEFVSYTMNSETVYCKLPLQKSLVRGGTEQQVRKNSPTKKGPAIAKSLSRSLMHPSNEKKRTKCTFLPHHIHRHLSPLTINKETHQPQRHLPTRHPFRVVDRNINNSVSFRLLLYQQMSILRSSTW